MLTLYIALILLPFAVSLANIKEEFRQSESAWVMVGMIPHYNSSADERPKIGGYSSGMRNIELIQACYHVLLEDFIKKTSDILLMQWATGEWFQTKVFVACLLADQQECDKFCCNNGNCHQCWALQQDWLNLDLPFSLKTAENVKERVLAAAQGIIGVDPHSKRRVVLKGVSQRDYNNAKAQCGGFHLLNNGFWGVPDFDVQQQTIRDVMHGVDLGITNTVLSGICDVLKKVLYLNDIMLTLCTYYVDIMLT